MHAKMHANNNFLNIILITPLVEAHLSTTTRSWATLKWAYTTPVFLSSPPDLLMDKAKRAPSGDNFLKTRAALHSRNQTESYQIL
jgi:hypothetical protein